MGMLDDEFQEPQSVKCMRHVNKIAEANWKAYVSEGSKKMRGHLMQYPVQVGREGKVGPLLGFETFPDVGGKVLGAPTTLPDALTT